MIWYVCTMMLMIYACERLENKQGVTSVKGKTDQVMLVGWKCSLMDCEMGCHCGLMDGAA